MLNPDVDVPQELGFVTNPKARAALNERISEIEEILAAIGFEISGTGKVVRDGEPGRFNWKAVLAGGAIQLSQTMVFTQATWLTYAAYALYFIAFAGQWDEYRYQRRLDPHRIKLKEFEIELRNIRGQLFGRWATWRIDVAKLDSALLRAIDEHTLRFDKDKNGKQNGRFRLIVSPETYAHTDELGKVDTFVDAGTAELAVEGLIKPDPSSQSSRSEAPYIYVWLKLHNGRHSTEYIVHSHAESAVWHHFKKPELVLPKSWPKLLVLHQSARTAP